MGCRWSHGTAAPLDTELSPLRRHGCDEVTVLCYTRRRRPRSGAPGRHGPARAASGTARTLSRSHSAGYQSVSPAYGGVDTYGSRTHWSAACCAWRCPAWLGGRVIVLRSARASGGPRLG